MRGFSLSASLFRGRCTFVHFTNKNISEKNCHPCMSLFTYCLFKFNDVFANQEANMHAKVKITVGLYSYYIYIQDPMSRHRENIQSCRKFAKLSQIFKVVQSYTKLLIVARQIPKIAQSCEQLYKNA